MLFINSDPMEMDATGQGHRCGIEDGMNRTDICFLNNKCQSCGFPFLYTCMLLGMHIHVWFLYISCYMPTRTEPFVIKCIESSVVKAIVPKRGEGGREREGEGRTGRSERDGEGWRGMERDGEGGQVGEVG